MESQITNVLKGGHCLGKQSTALDRLHLEE